MPSYSTRRLEPAVRDQIGAHNLDRLLATAAW